MPQPSVVAIDGPVAAGKTEVGRRVAERLGYRFLDTGLLYRAVTWGVLASGVELEQPGPAAAVAGRLTIGLAETNGRVLVDGRDVTADLRSPPVEQAVSPISRIGPIRDLLLERQRSMASTGRIVVAGRDIGTRVLPEADLKVFLTASLEERAARKEQALAARGVATPYDEVLREVERRDRMDSEREVAPLRAADDAEVLHTDGMSVEQSVERILSLAQAYVP